MPVHSLTVFWLQLVPSCSGLGMVDASNINQVHAPGSALALDKRHRLASVVRIRKHMGEAIVSLA